MMKNKTLKCLAIFLLFASISYANVYYVKTAENGGSDSNSGTSWDNAFVTIQHAIDTAAYGDEVWVAAGIYAMDPASSAQVFIYLHGGVKLYGGFAGNEIDLSSRDPSSYVTTLMAGTELWKTCISVSTYRIDALPEDTVVDGFNFQNNPTAIHLVGSAMIKNNIISNSSGSCEKPYSGITSHCPFPIIKNNKIINNYCFANGGGIIIWSCENGEISNNIIKNCLANTNTISLPDDGGGGAIWAHHCDGLTIKNNIFENNTANTFGGAIYLQGCSFSIINNLFINNQTTKIEDNLMTYGGGAIGISVYSDTYSYGSIYNNTFVSNSTASRGGAIFITRDSYCNIQNNIFYNNAAGLEGQDIFCDDITNPVASYSLGYCDFYNLNGSSLAGAAPQPNNNNIAVDPCFVNRGDTNPDYHVQTGSPCINAGNPDSSMERTSDLYVGLTDLGDAYRIMDYRVDIGAYEYPGAIPTPTLSPTPTLTLTPTPMPTPTDEPPAPTPTEPPQPTPTFVPYPITISGVVQGIGDPAPRISGVQIKIGSVLCDTTDATGQFSFDVTAPWTATLTLVKAGWRFGWGTPITWSSTKAYTGILTNLPNQVFYATPGGDANCDGKVDVSDLGILSAHYGITSGATWAMGDFNSDGKIDVADLGILTGNYGYGAGDNPVPIIGDAHLEVSYLGTLNSTLDRFKVTLVSDSPSYPLAAWDGDFTGSLYQKWRGDEDEYGNIVYSATLIGINSNKDTCYYNLTPTFYPSEDNDLSGTLGEGNGTYLKDGVFTFSNVASVDLAQIVVPVNNSFQITGDVSNSLGEKFHFQVTADKNNYGSFNPTN